MGGWWGAENAGVGRQGGFLRSKKCRTRVWVLVRAFGRPIIKKIKKTLVEHVYEKSYACSWGENGGYRARTYLVTRKGS